MNRTKILVGIIIFLFVTNVTTVVTGLLRTSGTQKEVTPGIVVPQNQRAAFFQQQLGLNNEQRKEFRKFTMDYNGKASKLTNNLNSLRYQLVDELALPSPGKKKLEKITRDIGDLHYQLKMVTVDYYTNMKGVCDITQQKKLHELFRVMADPGGDITTIRPGKGSPDDMGTRRGVKPNTQDNYRNN